MQKIKYITNKELLAEIQRSKATYCHFTASVFASYDAIVSNTEALTPEFIAATLQTKLARMAKQGIEQSVTEADMVFRVMSDVHLPEETDEKRRRKSSSGGWIPRTNFPPFQHFVLLDDILIEVGRSHWKGGLENGQFSTMHGRITDRLANMFLLLVDRYSRGGSWRGYCVDEATEALTQRGWLGIDEITETDRVLSYDAGKLKWSKIRSVYREQFAGKMFHLTTVGMDALVTSGHRFVTTDGLRPIDLLRERDKIILTGDAVADGPAVYDDAFVELVGWFVTEGNVAFHLTKETCQQLLAVAPCKILSMPFILSLSHSQRELLIRTMIDADGSVTKPYEGNKGGYLRYSQKNKASTDAFLALCTIAGYRASCTERSIVSYGKAGTINVVNIFSDRCNHAVIESIDFHGGKSNGQAYPGRGEEFHPNVPTVDYNGRIWCVETEYGSFMARRNGRIYLTGNSYVADMRGQALVQLTQVGLQFDESRSDNPFAWYTQIIKNVFRRILLLEKRNQDIRDDLLIMAGAMPSYTRQVDDELDHKSDAPSGDSDTEPKKEVKKRGRKPKIRL